MKPLQNTKPRKPGKNSARDLRAALQQRNANSMNSSLTSGTKAFGFQSKSPSDEFSNEISHPSHYNQGIEVIDFIDSWHLGFYIATIVKYLLRAPFKGTELKDLKKAQWYLNRYISLKERNIG